MTPHDLHIAFDRARHFAKQDLLTRDGDGHYLQWGRQYVLADMHTFVPFGLDMRAHGWVFGWNEATKMYETTAGEKLRLK